MLKWYGITKVGNDKKMTLAILCSACPQPGINIPAGWEKVPKETRSVIFHCMSWILKHIQLVIHSVFGPWWLPNEDGPISMIWLIVPDKWTLDCAKTLLKTISGIKIGWKLLELVVVLFLPLFLRLNINIRNDTPPENKTGHSGIKTTPWCMAANVECPWHWSYLEMDRRD